MNMNRAQRRSQSKLEKKNQTSPWPSGNFSTLSKGLNMTIQNSKANLPPLENLSLDMNSITNMLNAEQKSQNQESDTGILDALEPKTRTPKFKKLQKDLNENITSIGVIVYAINQADGSVIIGRAESLSNNLTDLAEKKPAVYNAIMKLMESGVYSALAIDAFVITNAILANHGINPLEKVLGAFKKPKKGQEKVSDSDW